MRFNDRLTHSEKTQAIADCLRDIMAVDITHRTMPALMNRGKAISGLIMADIKEEIMESKRQGAQTMLIKIDQQATKKLKKVKKSKELTA